MHRKATIFGAVLAIALACSWARAGEDDVLLPYLDDNSFLIVRLDEPALDIQADIQWISSAFAAAKLDADALAAMTKQIAEGFKDADEWTRKFRAAGGKRIYVVLSVSDLPDPGPFIVVPVEGGADGAALAAVFVGNNKEHSELIGNAVVFGNDKTRERLKAQPPGNFRPEFAEAMAALGNMPARAVLVPSPGVRQSLETAAPKLPTALGGMPMTVLTQGVRWAALGIAPPAEPALKLVVQVKDAAAAQELVKLEALSIQWVADNSRRAQFDIKRALSLIAVGVEGDRVVVSLSSGQIRDLIASVIAPTMAKAWHQEKEAPSAENISLLALGCYSYSARHKQKWPDSLDEIADEVGGKAALEGLKRGLPRDGGTPQYLYRKPTDTRRRYAEIIVVYETFEQSPSPARLAAAFADGHVEFLAPEELKHRLEALGGR